jgi:hypothetical protein
VLQILVRRTLVLPTPVPPTLAPPTLAPPIRAQRTHVPPTPARQRKWRRADAMFRACSRPPRIPAPPVRPARSIHVQPPARLTRVQPIPVPQPTLARSIPAQLPVRRRTPVLPTPVLPTPVPPILALPIPAPPQPPRLTSATKSYRRFTTA